jgi:hypothetical protein
MIRKGNSQFLILNFELWKISAKRKSVVNSKLRIQNSKFAAPVLVILVLLAGFLLTGAAAAAPLTSGADFLLNPVGARPDGMGQAYSAVADDLYALSFNPAGLAGIHELEIGYGREEFVAGIHYDFFAVGLPVADLGVLSLGYIGLGTDPFNSTADTSAALVSDADTAILASWGNSFYPFGDGSALQAGFTAKYIDRQLAGIQGTGLAFDAGLRYVNRQGLAFSASAMNMGPGVQFSSLEPLPMLLDFGAAYKILDQPLHSLVLAGDSAWNLFSQTQQYSAGLEYWFRGQFAVRAGYVFNSQVEGPSVGAGLKLDFFELDYAFQPDNNLGTVNRLSGLFRFDGPTAGMADPVAPQKVEVQPKPGGFQVSWSNAAPQDKAFEVLLQPFGGGTLVVSNPTEGASFTYNDKGSHLLYSVQVRALGQNGQRSQPSPAAYVFSAGSKRINLPTEGVSAEANKIGLNLSWKAPRDFAASGYNLYSLSPSGRVTKLSLAPKKNNRVLLGGDLGRNNVQYIVTAVGPDGSAEEIIGSYIWNPTDQARDILSQAPAIKLQANLTHDQQIFLGWDAVADAKAYSLFYSAQPDGIYEFYGNLTDPKPTVLLQLVTKEKELHFLLAALSVDGRWEARSNDAKVSMVAEP